ncbi:MAG: 50S ribosomal protein L6, partial [Candidatus Marsarchaeota archaeon]|nr:50S ribosomal protein L6 [Candidatus Marsarchaeota archaeon]
VKRFNPRMIAVKEESGKLVVSESGNKKLAKRAGYSSKAFSSELKTAMDGVQSGIMQKMVIFYAHFPMTLEVKSGKIIVKNLFGERAARETSIVGDTKVEVKGHDVTVRGVDRYDVGQTVANIRKICFARGNDTRVFQDGVYLAKEE